MGGIPHGMHPGVSPAGSRHGYFLAEQGGQGILETFLHGGHSGLDLPAAESGTVI